jgi:hypothetical protein
MLPYRSKSGPKENHPLHLPSLSYTVMSATMMTTHVNGNDSSNGSLSIANDCYNNNGRLRLSSKSSKVTNRISTLPITITITIMLFMSLVMLSSLPLSVTADYPACGCTLPSAVFDPLLSSFLISLYFVISDHYRSYQ